jgi:hypothetical protein
MSEVSKAASRRQTGESKFFNLFSLRRLYNIDNTGRGIKDKKSRYDMHTTITFITFYHLTKAIPVGRGMYGSAVVELAIRLLVAVVNKSVPLDKIAEELAVSITDRSELSMNLKLLANLIDRQA